MVQTARPTRKPRRRDHAYARVAGEGGFAVFWTTLVSQLRRLDSGAPRTAAHTKNIAMGIGIVSLSSSHRSCVCNLF
jgi:hypothetical protein